MLIDQSDLSVSGLNSEYEGSSVLHMPVNSCSNFGVANSTLGNIKKNRNVILEM
jgi:hypothetical protein